MGLWLTSFAWAIGFEGPIGKRNYGASNYNGNIVFWYQPYQSSSSGSPSSPKKSPFFFHKNNFKNQETIKLQPFGRFISGNRGTPFPRSAIMGIPHWVFVGSWLTCGILAAVFKTRENEPTGTEAGSSAV